MAQIITLFISFLINSLIIAIFLSHFANSRSSPFPKNYPNFQVLDVSSSLQQTHQVFSASLQRIQAHNSSSVNENHPFFSIIIHPRSTLFPHHNKNYTSLSLARLARDSVRVDSLIGVTVQTEQLESPVTSGAEQGSGEYFARIGVGQPVKESYMVIDSGSDVSWLQCQPCSECYDQSDPIYNPSASSTYHPLSCTSERCEALHTSACRVDTCLYQVSYGDGSSTAGEFATDTVSFGESGSVSDVALGCGHDNQGLFVAADGLLGLGGGPLSIPSQIKATSFSYCLVNRDSSSSSTLEFNSAQPGDSVLAPLLKNSVIDTYYYVGLTGFDVGGTTVEIPASIFDISGDGKGGVIVDSGTAVTRLRTEAYNALRDAFVQMSQDLPSTDSFALFDTCYDFSSMRSVKVPTVSFKFAGGETLPIKPGNYLIPVNNAGKHCFAFAPTAGSLSIIGNVQQQGTRVSYDLASRKIGFSPNKC